MGLEEFKRTEIRSAVMGIIVIITEDIIARAARCSNSRKFHLGVKNDSPWVENINKTLHEGRPSDKTCHMLDDYKVLQKLIIQCFMPRDNGTDYKYLDHNLFLYFLIHYEKANLPKYMSNYMCWAINESCSIKRRRQVPYARLLSEIFLS